MFLIVCVGIYMAIGAIIAEIGMQIISKEYPTLKLSMQPYHYVIVYGFLMLFWFFAIIDGLIKKGFEK